MWTKSAHGISTLYCGTLLACQLKTREKLSAKEPADECLEDIISENETSCLYAFLAKYAIS